MSNIKRMTAAPLSTKTVDAQKTQGALSSKKNDTKTFHESVPLFRDVHSPIYNDYTFQIYRPDVLPNNVITRLNKIAAQKLETITDARQRMPRSELVQNLRKIGWHNLQRGFGESSTVLWIPQAPVRQPDDILKMKKAQLTLLQQTANTASFASIHAEPLSSYWQKKANTLSTEESAKIAQFYDIICKTNLHQLSSAQKNLLLTVPLSVFLRSKQKDLAIYSVHSDPMLFQQQFNTRVQHHHALNPYQCHILLSMPTHEPAGSLTPIDTTHVYTHLADSKIYKDTWHQYDLLARQLNHPNYAAAHLQDFLYRGVLGTPTDIDRALGVKTVLASINRALGGTYSIPPYIQRAFGPRWQNSNFLQVE